MFNKKTYELSLTRGYVSSWGTVQAVRELIQNQLDSGSPFVYEFFKDSSDPDKQTLKLRSEFSQLTPQTLLLGTSSKGDNPNAIGSFGEGYKIAMLVLTREEKRVEIHNGRMLWTPRFKMNSTFGEELLAIEEEALPHKHMGLDYYVHDLDDAEVNSIIESCLKMQKDIGKVKETRFGNILFDRPGKLYVGSLYVCETDMDHGYDIKPEFLTLERDRQTVSNWDLKAQVRHMWADTGDVDYIAEMISKESPDVYYFKFDSTELVREACYQHFKKSHPGKVIAETDKELKSLVEKGMTVYVSGGGYYSQVSQSRSYRDEYKAVAIKTAAPSEVLQEFLKTNRKHFDRILMVEFKSLIERAADWKN